MTRSLIEDELLAKDRILAEELEAFRLNINSAVGCTKIQEHVIRGIHKIVNLEFLKLKERLGISNIKINL